MNVNSATANPQLAMPNLDWPELLQRLSEPFDPANLQWRAGSTSKDKTKALALVYADARVYEARLDNLCPGAWEVTFEPWGDSRIICRLTIHDITRSSTGEDTSNSDNAGTTAEAQAFKRACSKFGVGRYLYDLPATWVPYDAATKRLKETPRITMDTNSGSLPQGYEVIGNERAAAMHRELARTGIPSSEHYKFASTAIGRTIMSLASLTESEAAKTWRATKQHAS